MKNCNETKNVMNLMKTRICGKPAEGFYKATITSVQVATDGSAIKLTLSNDRFEITDTIGYDFVIHPMDDIADQLNLDYELSELLKKIKGKEVEFRLYYNEGVNARGKYARWTNFEYISKEVYEHRLEVEAAEAAKKAEANKSIR